MVTDKPVIAAFNKQDAETARSIKDLKADLSVKISARTGLGLEDLVLEIEHILREQKVYIEKTFSYADAGKLQEIRKTGQLITEDYREDGIYVEAYVKKETAGRLC